MTCTVVCSLPICSSSLTNFLADFAAALPEDVTEDQVDKLIKNSKPPSNSNAFGEG